MALQKHSAGGKAEIPLLTAGKELIIDVVNHVQRDINTNGQRPIRRIDRRAINSHEAVTPPPSSTPTRGVTPPPTTGPLRPCRNCRTDTPATGGITCSKAHFTCNTCLVSLVKLAATRTDRFIRKAEISCPKGCVTYAANDLAASLDEDTYALFAKLQNDVIRYTIRKHFEAGMVDRIQQKKAEEIKKRAEISAIEREAEDIRHRIVNDILTLRCPRCRGAFIDFNGCFSVTCHCGCALVN